ncbi:MAG TPA: diguanylate cyclase [Solirubrobacterales bacterium]|nr:diguanylate cyclase [Solirubrobacterales bacterium]
MRRTRFWIGIAAVAAVAIGSVIAAAGVYVKDRDDFHRMQHDEAVRAARQMESVAGLSIAKLSSAAAFFEAERDLTGHEFGIIGRSLLSEGVLSAAAYIPRVPASERASYESAHGLEILERKPDQSLKRAGRRAEYFPLTYTTMVATPRRGFGYDVGADSHRRPYLLRARDSAAPVATSLVPLLLGGAGINVYKAIYRDGAPTATVAERRRALLGFVGGAFRVEDLAGTATAALPDNVEAQLWMGRKLVDGPGGELEDATTAPVHIADRTWLLAVKDPGGADLSLPLALGVLGIALAALLASLIVSWDRKERLRELERQASEDSLTGLDNRRRFEQNLAASMARSRRDSSTGALLVLDLDGFKRVNDSGGHPAGDRVLEGVAAVLRQRVRAGDSLARLGGDEFAVILPRCSPQEATLAAEALTREIREQRTDGDDQITVSVGIAMFGEDPRTSLTTLISEADTAMYAAKDAGGDNVRIFDPLAVREDATEGR